MGSYFRSQYEMIDEVKMEDINQNVELHDYKSKSFLAKLKTCLKALLNIKK